MQEHINFNELRIKLSTAWTFIIITAGIFFGGIWWAATMSAKVDNIGDKVTRIENKLDARFVASDR